MATIEPQLKLPENVTMYIWAEKLFAKVYTIYRLPCSDTRLIRARTDHSPNAIGARQGTLDPDNGSQASEARSTVARQDPWMRHFMEACLTVSVKVDTQIYKCIMYNL